MYNFLLLNAEDNSQKISSTSSANRFKVDDTKHKW